MPQVLRSRDGRGRVRSAQVAPRSWPQSYTDEVHFSGIDGEIFVGDLGVASWFCLRFWVAIVSHWNFGILHGFVIWMYLLLDVNVVSIIYVIYNTYIFICIQMLVDDNMMIQGQVSFLEGNPTSFWLKTPCALTPYFGSGFYQGIGLVKRDSRRQCGWISCTHAFCREWRTFLILHSTKSGNKNP